MSAWLAAADSAPVSEVPGLQFDRREAAVLLFGAATSSRHWAPSSIPYSQRSGGENFRETSERPNALPQLGVDRDDQVAGLGGDQQQAAAGDERDLRRGDLLEADVAAVPAELDQPQLSAGGVGEPAFVGTEPVASRSASA